jgi:glycosyltransferase involved in cell wall biosynthesis
MVGPVNIVMLLTDGFGGFGGIAKFNRDFIQGISASSIVERMYVLPRLIPHPIEEPIPESVVYDRKAARGKFAYLCRVLWYARSGTKPDLVICGHLNLLPAAWLLARLRGARLVLIIHGIEARKRRSWLFGLMQRSIDSFITVSRYSARRFVAWSNVSQDQFFILPNCVELNLFVPEPRNVNLVARYGLQDNKLILTVGRISSQERYKGFDEVIDVMPELLRRFPTLKYMIVGEGDDRRRLEKKVSALGLSKEVMFTGRIPEQEKASHYSLADAYVMPSYGEGFGIVFLEAMACGVPVIGSKVDGSREALLDGQLGRLVDPNIPDELVEAITDVLTNSSCRKRNALVACFDVGHFRSRVAEWLMTQSVRLKRNVE